MGQQWKGGNMAYPGGGQKVLLLKEKLNSLKDTVKKDTIILFTDRYDHLNFQ